jgi:hypothetical protein
LIPSNEEKKDTVLSLGFYSRAIEREDKRLGKDKDYNALRFKKDWLGEDRNKFLLYAGEFKDGLPHGRGLQIHGSENRRTVYEGQFANAVRHGIGLWDGVDHDSRMFRYLGVPNATANNWTKGEMHGVAQLELAEDKTGLLHKRVVHERVMYIHGKATQPPRPRIPTQNHYRIPEPGFANKRLPDDPHVDADEHLDLLRVSGLCFKDAPAKSSQVKDPSDQAKPKQIYGLVEMEQEALGDKFGAIMEQEALKVLADKALVVHLESIMSSLRVTFAWERRNPDVMQSDQAAPVSVLVRQDTDINSALEDIWVTGGTKGNQVLNGIYFRMSGTFGTPIYQHTIVSAGPPHDPHHEAGEIISKYLYRDTSKDRWMISDSTEWLTESMLREYGKECAMFSINPSILEAY